MITVDLRQLPPSGKKIAGDTVGDVFGFTKNDPVQSVSPLTYDLTVRQIGDILHLEGCIGATFSLECGRCLERFLQTIQIPEYSAEIPLENGDILDLTAGLREDILLDLPGYPRCENGNVEPRECPSLGEFEIRESGGHRSVPPSDEPDKENVWGALDDFEIKP